MSDTFYGLAAGYAIYFVAVFMTALGWLAYRLTFCAGYADGTDETELIQVSVVTPTKQFTGYGCHCHARSQGCECALVCASNGAYRQRCGCGCHNACQACLCAELEQLLAATFGPD